MESGFLFRVKEFKCSTDLGEGEGGRGRSVYGLSSGSLLIVQLSESKQNVSQITHTPLRSYSCVHTLTSY